jgi:hypothetical protein
MFLRIRLSCSLVVDADHTLIQILRHFDLQLLQPYSPSDIMTYGTFLESNLLLRVTKS